MDITNVNYDNEIATSNNCMYMGHVEWTISRLANSSDGAFSVYGGGSVFGSDVYDYRAGRAVFNLESSVTYKSGTGPMSDPITINL